MDPNSTASVRFAGGQGGYPPAILDTSTSKLRTSRNRSYISDKTRQETIARRFREAGKTAMAQRLEDCSKYVAVSMRDCGHQATTTHRVFCGSSVCQHAACIKHRTKERKRNNIRRAIAVTKQLNARRQTGKSDNMRWRHLVLTTRSGRGAGEGLAPQELAASAARLWRYWTKFKQTWIDIPRRKPRKGDPFPLRYLDNLTGGVAALEFGGLNGMAHLHILILSPYRPAKWWRERWQAISGAHQIRINELRRGRHSQNALMSGMTEVIKYLTLSYGKHGDLTTATNAALACFGRNTTRTFGAMHGAAPPPPRECCPVCGCISSRCTDPILRTRPLAIEQARARLVRYTAEMLGGHQPWMES